MFHTFKHTKTYIFAVVKKKFWGGSSGDKYKEEKMRNKMALASDTCLLKVAILGS